jgi:hypothetical protein
MRRMPVSTAATSGAAPSPRVDQRRRARTGWWCGAALGCAGLTGCAGWWDEVTSREFKFKEMFRRPPDPMTVLQKDPDGDHRAKALRALHEPLQSGGSPQEQEAVVGVLVRCATTDPQPLCRLAAIETLGRFRDPRAVEALKEAYYRAGSVNPETAGILRCQVLAALGQSGQPAAVELLVKVLREPPVEGSEPEKQQKTDERIAAARALARFPRDAQVADALVGVLRNDRDVALRNRAHESLVSITGRDLPPEPEAWDNLLHHPQSREALAEQPGPLDRFLRRVSGQQ